MNTERDFVTVLPTSKPHLFLVAVMTWDARTDEYVTKKLAHHALKKYQAESLAASWAVTLQLEMR